MSQFGANNKRGCLGQMINADVLIAYLWAGTIVGVSFLATPVKFLVPQLNRTDALAIGQITFRAFLAVELVVLGLLLIAVIAQRKSLLTAPLMTLCLSFGLQKMWVLPQLDARVTQIVAGEQVAPANWHLIYVLLELIQLVALLAVPFWSSVRAISVDSTLKEIS